MSLVVKRNFVACPAVLFKYFKEKTEFLVNCSQKSQLQKLYNKCIYSLTMLNTKKKQLHTKVSSSAATKGVFEPKRHLKNLNIKISSHFLCIFLILSLLLKSLEWCMKDVNSVPHQKRFFFILEPQ